MTSVPVLIAGAGPTGLVLALWLTRRGIRVRIIDRTAEPGTTSRALGVQARTLEFYRQLGLAEAVVRQGLEFAAANLWVRGKRKARLAFGDIGVGLSPFPYMLIFPQDEHERFLIERLAALGVDVERRTELLGFKDDGWRVRARLRTPDGAEKACEAEYLAGCDGARSKVREVMGAAFPGGTYAHLFYVADTQGGGPVMNGELHGALDESDFLAAFPMKGAGRVRLIGTAEAPDGQDALTWEDVGKGLLARMSVTVDRVNWFSTYHVHHRVAERFRVGRVFLLGDAAHVHSPVGGQGMNTGIGDAVNLAWKLADVLRGRAAPTLLDSYEPERIAFARRLVATTDTVFELISRPGPIAARVRLIAPRLLGALFRLRSVRRFMFRTISQTALNYRRSALSQWRAGRVRGGDRLLWLAPEMREGRTDNFAALETRAWQVHVYGEASPDLAAVCRARCFALHIFPWRPAMRRTGLRRNALYLVRPDGYVALANSKGRAAELERYRSALAACHSVAARQPDMSDTGKLR